MFVDESRVVINEKVYPRALLRESYREDGKVKHRTIANISHCSDKEIKAIKFALKNKDAMADLANKMKPIEERQGLSVGAIIVIYEIAKRLGIENALGDKKEGKLALWQIMARIIDQGSRLSATRLASRHAVCDLLDLKAFHEDDLYKNLDWLCENQAAIEKKIYENRYRGKRKPRLYLYDVTSSYFEGEKNELANWGYNRDQKRGKKQIVIGLLTDEDGYPIAVRVFEGNTTDGETCYDQIKLLAEQYRIKKLTLVGDRGMIKSGQIAELHAAKFHYISAITKPQIETLLKENVIQMGLFSDVLCEIEYQQNRYILRRNPIRANEIAANRENKLQKLNKLLSEANDFLKLHPKARTKTQIKRLNGWALKLKMVKWIDFEIQDREIKININTDELESETKLDGCYVIKTDNIDKKIKGKELHDRYKDLAMVEESFRTMKTSFLETRPIYVQKESRTRGHVFVVMLSYFIVKYLKEQWRELNSTPFEAIEELTTLCSTQEWINGIPVYQKIIEPRDSINTLLKAAKIKLPKDLPCRNIIVSTRKTIKK